MPRLASSTLRLPPPPPPAPASIGSICAAALALDIDRVVKVLAGLLPLVETALALAALLLSPTSAVLVAATRVLKPAPAIAHLLVDVPVRLRTLAIGRTVLGLKMILRS